MSKKKLCSSCGAEVPVLATKCKRCGSKLVLVWEPSAVPSIRKTLPGIPGGQGTMTDISSTSEQLTTVPLPRLSSEALPAASAPKAGEADKIPENSFLLEHAAKQMAANATDVEQVLEELDESDIIILDKRDSPAPEKPALPRPRISLKGDKPGAGRLLWNSRMVKRIGIAAGALAIGLVGALFAGYNDESNESESVEQIVANIGVNPEVSSPIPPKSESSGKEVGCTPLAEYPVFPWRDLIKKGVSKLGHTGICHLFGLTPSYIAIALKGVPAFGPTGYDLLPDAQVMEFFPLGKAVRSAPAIEFIFLDERVAEIHLKYRHIVGKRMESDIFKEVFGAPVAIGKDHLQRDFVRFDDGNMVVQQSTFEDEYKRVSRGISFLSQTALKNMQGENEQRFKAEAAFSRGLTAFNNHRVQEAITNFQAAREYVPGFGAAYALEGILEMGEEKFGSAAHLASQAMLFSRDSRTQAEARGIRGVTALYEGNRALALDHFRSAGKLDPTRGKFMKSVDELETGRYGPSRVAKTAARMSCGYDKEGKKNDRPRHTKSWTLKGLLARGNFPDRETYEKALKQSERDRFFQREYKRWVSWECP